MTFSRSQSALLQSLPRTLDSMSSALATSWVAEASLCPDPESPSSAHLCLPEYLGEDQGLCPAQGHRSSRGSWTCPQAGWAVGTLDCWEGAGTVCGLSLLRVISLDQVHPLFNGNGLPSNLS